ncbi:NADPH-dependent FMN reductase [Pseudopedobacter saltans DSM 12145]|uniref:NADPH-dependent FMN reductase n=1 Tax=Pseudopedobacter saltans (strain ATCC 51119 / DSM 12145 / JCM 21818 / CCUG 39354 / LMG 10337 / NBRC 100064 / NCIMB 13643) TaxID=762903 RepID=F0S940_PSESL|nr:NADPH-dependent FMN reductase [Pseudopedobacter saltans]ADY51338.1 NADPH-dependent FMN reductase [Pseudopedobacter saltans DSM 12145]
MKIVAFAGSNSSRSINKSLVEYTLQYFEGSDIELLDLNDYEMPIFSVDRERDGYPEEAHQFLSKIENADALIISLAEHNRSYSTAFKNILDWISRIEKQPFFNKPTLLMSTSPGGYGGGNVMQTATKFFPQFGVEILSTFSLPKFHENFKVGEGLINEEYKAELEKAIDTFKSKLDLK